MMTTDNSRADALTDRAKRLIQRVASAQLAVAELPPGMPRTAVSDTIDEARAFARATLAAFAVEQPAAADARVGLTDKFEDWWKSLEGTAHRHDEFYVGVDGDWIHKNDVEDIWKTLRGDKTS